MDLSEDVLSEAPLADWTLNHVWFIALRLLACYEFIGRRELILSMLLLDCLRKVPLSKIYDWLLVFV